MHQLLRQRWIRFRQSMNRSKGHNNLLAMYRQIEVPAERRGSL
jgi:hypothetical protein